ncbi:hypothetical protein FRB93_010292 [Tulasnella sp. JGI-2019a]|nr:hypothetical protein FRB93_010292 [Tulasnella sp. JGI-2019a]
MLPTLSIGYKTGTTRWKLRLRVMTYGIYLVGCYRTIPWPMLSMSRKSQETTSLCLPEAVLAVINGIPVFYFSPLISTMYLRVPLLSPIIVSLCDFVIDSKDTIASQWYSCPESLLALTHQSWNHPGILVRKLVP